MYCSTFLLFINPLSSGLVLLGFALFFKGKRFGITLLIIDTLLTLFMYANVIFFIAISATLLQCKR